MPKSDFSAHFWAIFNLKHCYPLTVWNAYHHSHLSLQKISMMKYLGKKVRLDVHNKTKKCTENCACLHIFLCTLPKRMKKFRLAPISSGLTFELNRLHQHPSRSFFIKAQFFGCSGRKVDNAAWYKGTPVVYPKDDTPMIFKICNANISG